MNSKDLFSSGIDIVDEMDAELGDPRRTERLHWLASALAEEPDKSFPELFEDGADLAAVYRFFGNQHISHNDVLHAHVDRTVARSHRLGAVLVIHDSTEHDYARHSSHLREGFCLLRKNRQGFSNHVTLVVSDDGLRCPVGVLGMIPYVHSKDTSATRDPESWEQLRRYWHEEFGSPMSSYDRWLMGIERARDELDGVEQVIHVMDREADAFELLGEMALAADRFIIRANNDRRAHDPEDAELRYLSESIAKAEFIAERSVELSPRWQQLASPSKKKRHPTRRHRTARLSFRACSATIRRPHQNSAGKDHRHLPKLLSINLIEAVELNPPQGEPPVRWLLMTSEPIDTIDDILLVVDRYRARWVIEEFNKATKTGAGYAKRQLDSAHSMLIALAVTLPVAWSLLVIRHLDRTAPHLPAAVLFSLVQVAVLKAAQPKLNWSEKPTIGEATQALAKLGGHLKRNGKPGWQILGRGYQRMLQQEVGWRAAIAAMPNLQSSVES